MTFSSLKLAQRTLAAFLAAAIVVCAPGPWCYEALAGTLGTSGVTVVPEGNLAAGGAAAANLTGPSLDTTLPASLDASLSAGLPGLPLGEGTHAPAPAAEQPLTVAQAAFPLAGAQQAHATFQPATRSFIETPAGALPARDHAALDQGHAVRAEERTPAHTPARASETDPAASANQDRPDALGAVREMRNLGPAAGPRFDGGGALKAGEDASAADAGAADAPPTRSKDEEHRLLYYQRLSDYQKSGGKLPAVGVEPKGPTREFWMGWKTELRHWLFRKKLLIEPFKLHWNWPWLPQWFGDGLRPYLGRHLATAVGNILGTYFSGVWILYSNVISLRKTRLFGTRFATVEQPAQEKSSKDRLSSDGSAVESDPKAGQVGTAMSHSVPLEVIRGNSPTIHPRVVRIADKLLNRNKFRPARGVSSHFGVHVQRVPVHGLFRHDLSEDQRIKVPLPAGRTLDGKDAVVLEATRQAPNKKPGFENLPVYLNQMSSAWHFNEMYGPDWATTWRLRSRAGGLMRMEEGGLPPLDPRYATPDGGGIYDFGNNENMSVPLAIQHILWLRVHNWFAGALKEHFSLDAPPAGIKDKALWWKQKREFDALPDLRPAGVEGPGIFSKDDWLFEKTRINLTFKNDEVHTNDWTPILQPNPVVSLGLHMDWAGLLGLKVKRLWYTRPWVRKSFLGAILKDDLLSGVPGSPFEEWSSEYDMGETFALVYLLRELMRDKYPIYSYKTGKLLAELDLSELVGPNVHKVMKRFSQEDLWYSMGIVNPGDTVNNNVPNALRKIRIQKKGAEVRDLLRLKDEFGAAVRQFGPQSAQAKALKEKLDAQVEVKDLAITDLVRADERQWPTYLQLLKAMDLPIPKSFLELTGGDAELASILDELYDGDLSRVHAHIGIRVAPRPPGFILSLVSFMLFGQKAPERLKSNRRLSEGFTPEIATEFGMDWQLSGEESKEVLLRILPALAPALDGKSSIFFEWNRIHPQTDAAQAAKDYEGGVVTPDLAHLSGMGPTALDTLYRNTGDAGAIPDGISNGKALFRPATKTGRFLSWIASFVWQGKAFDRGNASLKNRILGFARIIPASVTYGESWFDGGRSIIIDYKGKSWWPLSLIRDEIRQVAPNAYVGYAFVRVPWGLQWLFGKSWNVLRFAVEFPEGAAAKETHPAKASSWEDRTEALIQRADRRANKLWRASALILPLALAGAFWAFPGFWPAAGLLAAFLGLSVRNGAALDRHQRGIQGLLHAYNFILMTDEARAQEKRLLAEPDQSRVEKELAEVRETLARRNGYSLEVMRYLNNTVEPPVARVGRRSLLQGGLAALAASGLLYLAFSAVNPLAALALAALPLLMAAVAYALHRGLAKDLELIHVSLSSRLREARPKRDSSGLPGDSHLEKHLRYFSGGREIIRMALATLYGKIRALGIPAKMAIGTFIGAHLSFGRKTQKNMTPEEKARFKPDFFDIYTPRVTDAWIATHTGVYGKDGNIDMAEFESLFPEGKDYVTAKRMAAVRYARYLRAWRWAAAQTSLWKRLKGYLTAFIGYHFATKRQFDQLFMVAPDRTVVEDGKLVPAISRGQLLYWYEGGLRYDIAEEHEAPR